ncbi:hypothetical protein NC652_011091 [Populus alba x Populus x berolinensis]|uniref:Regulator of Vps4 activity in the MVB pathway protein n=1 Tax=Populus tomentosa TaxID=118781 RepID=A0A8X8A228_POPTO|nr:hypothetical protein POTOM_015557 [Populus tomentosa]KAJ6936254.1 hypothetical protein NC652_011091 [Populus alba x Populus x berolinensis]
MGKKLDALFGRKLRTSKFSSLSKLAVSRIAILKNKAEVRLSHAKSDVIQLLNLGHQERALLRVEHVIKDQNMVGAFVMMEDYLHFLNDRVVLLQTNRECPDELKEAVSSLIFASSRCGEFPELQEIRGVFVSRFGKEIAACAVELRSNCGVNPKIILKFSARQASLESRKKLLKDIASDNGIVLHLEEDAPVVAQEKMDVSQPKQQEQHVEDFKSAKLDVTESQARTHVLPEDELSESLKGRKKYKDVAAAALEAFESAAYAAQAARAAVELSRYDSQDIERDDHGDSSHGQGTLYDSDGSLTPELEGRYEASEENKQAARAAVELSRYDSQDIERDDHGDSSHGQGTLYDSDGSLTPELQGRYEASEENKQAARAAVELSRYDSQDIEWDDRHGQGTLYDSDGPLIPELQGRYEASEENKLSNDSLVFNEIYTIDNISSESEDENMKGNGRVHLEFEESKTKPGFNRTPSNSSSDSDGNMWNERYQLSDSLSHNKPVGNEMVSYLVDKKAEREQVTIPSPKHHDLDLCRNTNLLADENQHIREYNAVHDEDVSCEDEDKLPYQSPKRIPLKPHADAMINPRKGNYEYKTAHSTTSDENLSTRSNIDRKRLSVRTRRARGPEKNK